MKYSWVLIVIGLILLGGWFVIKGQGTSGQYCQSDGTLESKKPIQSHRSYCLKSDANAKSFMPNTATSYSFSLIDDQGKTLKEFDTVHEKIMHVIVAREDLANFQHLHPEYNQSTGEFTLTSLTLPTDGQYRIFADFTPTGSQMGADNMKLPVTLSEDLAVGNVANYKPQALGDAENMKTFDGYSVTLTTVPNPILSGTERKLIFTIEKNGKQVTNLEPYLGALGHSVILSEGDLDFIHAHALNTASDTQNGTIIFAATLPKAGKYKAFTQFQHEGIVITTNFVVEAAQGSEAESETTPMPDMMPGMEH